MLERIDPDKDADGLHPMNLGRLVLGYAGAAAVHPARHRRAAAPVRRAAAPAPRWWWSAGAPPSAGRSGLLLTRRSENATVTTLPHRHP